MSVSNESGGNSNNVPIPHSVSIKMEQTTKGVRVSIHEYGNDASLLITNIITDYEELVKRLGEHEIPVAPMEKV
jgi:hypothetical protein